MLNPTPNPTPKPKLELQMIVKNGAATLARCLRSVAGIADRVTIGDTGSTDETLAVADRFDARVLSVPWQKDFAKARNRVLEQAECDWILFLDADEMLDEEAQAELPRLLRDPTVDAYDVTAWNYVFDTGFRSSGEQAQRNPVRTPEASGFPAYFPSTNTRLFRRNPSVYFEHCVHETIADRLAALRLARRSASFVIHHFGYVEDAGEQRAQKEKLYYHLALKKAARSAGSSQANLGAGIAELDHAKDAAKALGYLEKAIRLDRRRASAWLHAGICLTRLSRLPEAFAHLHQALALEPDNPLTSSSLGDLLLQAGEHTRACAAYERAIALGDVSPLTLAKLGAAEVHLGHGQSGITKVEQAMERDPASVELYDVYAPVAFLAGKPSQACEAAAHRLSLGNVTAYSFVLAATLHLHSGMRGRAEELIQAGARRFPNDAELRKMARSLASGEA